MSHQDLFVAAVAAALALFSLFSAVFNWDWSYQLDKAQHIESRWGRPAARGFYAAVAVLLLGLAWTITAATPHTVSSAKRTAPAAE